MARIDDLLEERLQKGEIKEKSTKVRALAARSNSGELSSFSSLFASSPLTHEEKEQLKEFLVLHSDEEAAQSHRIESDVDELSRIASEIRSISHQSILLHGERIKKAQSLLSSYKEGAFSAWLIRVYGNRQTPYNFLLYFDLYTALENALRAKIELMPKQAVYTLASRSAPQEEKIKFIQSYKGETKDELLQEIRRRFPLAKEDKRVKSPLLSLLSNLRRFEKEIHLKWGELDDKERAVVKKELNRLKSSLSIDTL